jgi:methionyl-tRNA synthetase
VHIARQLALRGNAHETTHGHVFADLADQLRTHFLSLGLGLRSVGFKPKPFNPDQDERAADPVMKEGNLLCNVFNRAVRSCFYTMQKFFAGKLPTGDVSREVLAEAEKVILDFEEAMYKYEFHAAIALLDNYIRGINKYWDKNIREAGEKNDDNLRRQTLLDTFHMVKVATVLLHPVAPHGTEKVREYLNLGEEFWSWQNIFKPLAELIGEPAQHDFKFLEPRVDFFEKHPSQAAAL